jgi:hypothetical protein
MKSNEPLLIAFLFALHTWVGAETPATLPTWTSVDGRTMQARLTAMEGDTATFINAAGQTTKIPLAKFAPADQDRIRQLAPPAPASGKATTNAKLPIDKRVWPAAVEIAPRSVEIRPVLETPEEKRCLYRSEAFEFVSQDKLSLDTVKKIAVVFEATRTLVTALPWGIEPHPPADLGLYQAKFYVTREGYIAEGGPPNSGGVYFSKDRVFRIPFQGLGLQMIGKTWFKKPDFKEETLVHEVTHQMMHEFLPFLPTWVIEGTAEYTESLPYNAGKFRSGDHKTAVKTYFAKRQELGGINASQFRSTIEHMTMKRDTWADLSKTSRTQHLLYFQSYALIYFFSHLDGDGKGTRFLKYLDAIAKARDEWDGFFKDPAVKHNPDGSFTYPTSLKLPEAKRSEAFGLEQLSILMDGRTPEQLESDFKSAYKKIGIKM